MPLLTEPVIAATLPAALVPELTPLPGTLPEPTKLPALATVPALEPEAPTFVPLPAGALDELQ
jgi:hypothetical protein